jgi:Zn-finger nucleic acid-binding protein
LQQKLDVGGSTALQYRIEFKEFQPDSIPQATSMIQQASEHSQENAVNCAQCGGLTSIVPGQQHLQCRFCSSLVFTTDNPLTVDRISPLGGTLESPCPCCQKPLQTGKIDEYPALYCQGCYGVLLRNEHFGAALRARRARRTVAESEDPRAIDLKQYERILRCPSCDGAMEVHPYYGPGNVMIDSCSGCGYLWLDHAELSRLERAAGAREILPPAIDPCLNEPSGCSIPSPFERTTSPLRVLADWLFC